MGSLVPSEAGMKVCVLTSVHSAFDDRIFHRECSSLARAGYDVTLIVPHERDEVVEGVRIKALPRPNGRFSRMTGGAYRAYREAMRQKAAVYHFHDPELIPVGLLLRAKGKKVVYDIHEDYPKDMLSKYYIPVWARSPLAWLVERFENIACSAFSALVPATPAIAERFNGLNARTVVVQNFPLPGELAPPSGAAWAERGFSVAYLGTISRNRGLKEMVEAVALLRDRMGVKLKLAGWFSPLTLQEEASRLPGWEQVEVLGAVGRDGVAKVLRSVRAGLVPFHPDPNHVRSGPNKMFEYMSAGIPVIASDFPLWREIIEGVRCGLVVDPLDPRAIAQAIEYLMTHDEEAEAMGARGREAIRDSYNWEIEERKLVELYSGLTAPESPG
jgi:glycosyltransferase involved in cell wall biosynthesis